MSDRPLRLFGLMLMMLALAVPLAQAPDRAVQSLVARWAPPPSDFVEVKGQLVHLRDEGPRNDPLPIVLLHGAAASLHTWEGWAAALRGQRRVITFDLPGFGLTGPFAGQYPIDDYSRAAHTRFVRDLLDTLHLDRYVIGGNGLGGEVAWQVAAAAPERARALILVASALEPVPAATEPLALTLARLPVIGAVGEWILPRALVASSLQASYGDPARVTAAQIDRYFELTLRSGNRAALRTWLQTPAPTRTASRIPSTRRPTLILWGARDRLLPVAAAGQLHHTIVGSRMQVFDDLGSLPQEEDAAATVAAVRSFLAIDVDNPTR